MFRLVGDLAGEVQAEQHVRGPLSFRQQPGRARVAAAAQLAFGGRMVRIRTDLETADVLFSRRTVVDARHHVHPLDQPPGDAGGSARLDHPVRQFGLADAAHRLAEFEDLRGQPSFTDRGQGAVARHAQMAAHQLADPVAVDPVVVVPSRLDDRVADPAARSLEHVPVGKEVRRAVDGVVADAAGGAGAGGRVADAHPRHHRVHGALAGCGGALPGEHVHRARIRGIVPFEHVRGHLHAVDHQCPRQFAQAQFAEHLEPRLAAHGELDAELSGGLAARAFDADPHGCHIRLAQPGGGGAAHITAEGLDAICLSRHSVFSSGWWMIR